MLDLALYKYHALTLTLPEVPLETSHIHHFKYNRTLRPSEIAYRFRKNTCPKIQFCCTLKPVCDKIIDYLNLSVKAILFIKLGKAE